MGARRSGAASQFSMVSASRLASRARRSAQGGSPVSMWCVSPVSWSSSPQQNEHHLRWKRDITLSRTTSKLKEDRIRPNLGRSDRSGHVEIFLAVGDRVEAQAHLCTGPCPRLMSRCLALAHDLHGPASSLPCPARPGAPARLTHRVEPPISHVQRRTENRESSHPSPCRRRLVWLSVP